MGPESIRLCLEPGSAEGIYRFECPACCEIVSKRADRKIVALLKSAGVDSTDALPAGSVGLAPAQPSLEDLPPTSDPPFTIDDMIRFHFLLEDPAFLRRLTEPT